MSVPPLVCSTPPPPDQVEEGYNDEFTFNYDDLSPSHQFETQEFSLYDDTPSPRDKPEDKICVSPSNITFHHEAASDTSTKSGEQAPSIPSDSFPNDRTAEEIPDDRTVQEIPDEIETSGFSEDCNVEDLDLKLDSLHIDFENERVTVEESLNSTFDDFGTFLSNTDFAQKMDNIFCESDKDSKSHGTCSEESTSLHNEDWDNISQNSFNTNSNTIPDQDEVNYIKKDNNDNISKDVITINSPSDIIAPSTNKEESIDSGFKSIINNSNDQIHDIKQDHLDSKSDVDISVTDANTLSFSECNDLDKCKVENDGEEDLSIDIPNKNEEQIDKECVVLENNFATFDNEENIDFKANFNDDFGSFAEAKPESSSFIDAKTNLDLNFSDETYTFEPTIDEFATFNNFESKDLKTVDKTIILKDTHISDEDEFEDFNEFQKDTLTETAKSADFQFVDSQKDVNLEEKPVNVDDDFGDFDTYDPNTMASQVKDNDSTISKACTLNDLVFTNETDIMEILKNAISTIYLEDGVSDHVDDDYELISTLGSSWKHLTEYETKQSYLFPWNNSSSQKTLLKSLGIDSRNILFGPKWNSGMPRFAANLGASPLQPIKQAVTQLDIQHEDKSSLNAEMDDSSSYSQPKMTDWQGDNFTMGDNQASSYAESLLLDLEHLMATLDQMTSGQSPHFKISDLFTNACTEREDEHIDKSYTAPVELDSKPEKHQPPSILNIGRKINLPDTHIFTPTDSETPWSHTIHYEDVSNSFVPNLPCDTNETLPSNNAEVIPTSHIKTEDDFDDFQSHSADGYIEQDNNMNQEQVKEDLHQVPLERMEIGEDKTSFNEFDDFGDFHSATTIEAVVHQPEIIQPTNLLQPTRVIPSVSVPVVNWPEPGDVDTSVFEQLSDLPAMQSTLPSWVENKEQPSWITENKEKHIKFEPKDLHIPPYVPSKVIPPAQTSFILKETKIDSVACDDAMPVNDIKASMNSEVDDFTDFQSVSVLPVSAHGKHPYGSNVISTTHITNNAPASQFTSNDFDDFQSAQYNTSSQNQINTTSFISSPQMPNYFLPSTLGESFLKSDNFNSATFQRFEEQSARNVPQQQILQPLSLENHSRINWPNPGLDMQDLSRFNPVNSIHSYSEPKETKINNHHSNDDDGWSDFVSIKTVNQPTKYLHQQNHNNQPNDEDDWSDFVSGTVIPSRSANEVKTISQNIQSQTNSANIMGPYNRSTQPNVMNSQYPNVAQNLTNLPHLSYSSTKINSKSNFQNL